MTVEATLLCRAASRAARFSDESSPVLQLVNDMFDGVRFQLLPAGLRLATVLVFAWQCVGSDSTALGQAEKPEVQYSVVRTSSGGVHAYSPGKWGALHVNLVNNRDVPRELLCATYFDGAPTLQYGRRVWLPPRSQLRTSQPILIPVMSPDQGKSLNFRSLVLDTTTSDEVLLRDDAGHLLHDGAILITHQSSITGLIDDRSDDIEKQSNETFDLAVACRINEGLSRQVALPANFLLAHDEYSLQALDHLVLASSRLADDAGAVASVRRWLFGGGSLWVMLDRTDPRILELLLGDRFNGHMVDRVGLTTVRINKVATDGSKPPVEVTDYEIPVDFVRVAVQDIEAAYEVEGWPAAFWMKCGNGRMLVTTLGARGWSTPSGGVSARAPVARTGAPTARNDSAPFHLRVTTPMSNLTTDFLAARLPELLPSTSLEKQVGEYIGYSIPPRGVILGTLAGMLFVLAALGAWMSARGAIEHLGWIGPVLAIVVSAVLLQIGRSNRHSIADTTASLQLVQPIPGTDDVQSHGAVAVYHREGSQEPIRAIHGGRLIPDMTGRDGSVRRMVWSDLDSWSWEHLPQSAGQQNAAFAVASVSVPRIEARATFTAEGLQGRVFGVPKLADAILATRDGRMGVTLKDDGVFLVRSEDVFGREQFLGADLLADEQDRRRRTLEKLLSSKQRRDYPQHPLLLAWTDRPNADFHFGDQLGARGSSLVAIPLVLDRPQTGDTFVIPAPWLSYRNTNAPDGTPPSAMWNYNLKEWQERAVPSSAWLRFQVPRELLPLFARRAQVVIQVAGPVGRLELLGKSYGAAQTIQTITDPVGRLVFDITDPGLLEITEAGELVLGLNAGDASRPELTHTQGDRDAKVNYWRIESLGLQLWAKPTETSTEE